MKNDNVKVLEEKLARAKTSQKEIDRNVVELTRVVKDSKNSKLGTALLLKSKSLQCDAEKELKEIQQKFEQAKHPETSYDETAKLLVDFNSSIDMLGTQKMRSGSFINYTKSYSLTAENKEAQNLNKAVRTELLEKFKAKDMMKSAKIEFGNFEKAYGELDIPKIVLMLSGDKNKGWADIPKQRGTIKFDTEIKENDEAEIKWQATYSGDKYQIVQTVSE